MPMKPTRLAIAAAISLAALVPHAGAQTPAKKHDDFFWLGEINKATAVINTDEGLLDKSLSPLLYKGITQVLADGDKPGGKRPSLVITFEPLLIEAAGPQITLLHAGRSSQDMLATARSAILRDEMLHLAEALNQTTATLIELAGKHRATVVPNYTNGVAAQPNSYGHYLLGIAAGLERDAQRIREAYARMDRSPMGTTVLNGTSWPLNRQRMAGYLGFSATVDNAYDAAQISAVDQPVEAGAIVMAIALHAGSFIEDVMTQYAQPRPWILLQEGGGNTYVSSAMPQKRNPGLLNSTRRDASTALNLGMGPALQAHNIPRHERPQGGPHQRRDGAGGGWRTEQLDPHPQQPGDRSPACAGGAQQRLDCLAGTGRCADAQVPAALPRRPPFRLGGRGVRQGQGHQASRVSVCAGATHLRRDGEGNGVRTGAASVRGRVPFHARPRGDRQEPPDRRRPQPAEMDRMLREATQRVAEQDGWLKARRAQIAASLARLDADFEKLGGAR